MSLKKIGTWLEKPWPKKLKGVPWILLEVGMQFGTWLATAMLAVVVCAPIYLWNVFTLEEQTWMFLLSSIVLTMGSCLWIHPKIFNAIAKHEDERKVERISERDLAGDFQFIHHD